MNRALLPLPTSLVWAGELVQLPTWNRLGPRRNVTCQIHHAACASLALASRLAASRVCSVDVCNDGGGVHTCVQAASGLCTLRLWLQNLWKKRLCWPAPATQSDAVSTSASDVHQTHRIFPLWAACIAHPLPVAAGGPAGQVGSRILLLASLRCQSRFTPGLEALRRRPRCCKARWIAGVCLRCCSSLRRLGWPSPVSRCRFASECSDGMERRPYLAFFSDDTASASCVGTWSPPWACPCRM